MNRFLLFAVALFPALLPLSASMAADSAPLQFQVSFREWSTSTAPDGRLFVILAHTNRPEPRFELGRTDRDAPLVLAKDVRDFALGKTAVLDQTAFAFPQPRLSEWPTGNYFVQALFDSNPDLRSAQAPGNCYSEVREISFDSARSGVVKLELSRQVPPEQSPPDTDQIKFIKLPSKLLSQFHGRPMFLRAGILLPRGYDSEPARRYPLWVRIGGLNARYTSVASLIAEHSDFHNTWLAADAPRLILLQLDGAGPLGDPYQVNSANNGPHGDALIQELIPFVEAKFRVLDRPRHRVLSGTSTGGWVALALQIFYPDFFAGAWSSCPDPVDFRAFELVNIYSDTNAFVNGHGYERPSARDPRGDVSLTMRREVGVENLLGRGNSYTFSGQSWGAWNAVFGPRGADGLPIPLWDPQTGAIDHAVAEQWKKYDLRMVLERNWQSLGPKLRGKIHIAAGESDQYFLNYAVHLLDDSLSRADPPFAGKIVYGPGRGHGWMDLSLRQMLEEMQAATAP